MRYLPLALLGPAALLAGLALLAIHPLLWLVNTWLDPAYGSYGAWIAALTVVLLLWSAASPLQATDPRRRWRGLTLLALTAGLRLFGQWLGISILGAAALAVDIYAISLLLGLERRVRAISPGWLAVLFAFALPIERILQRGFGFALQHLSAAGACNALQWSGAAVHCDGLQLQWHEQIILVDLPCSGTSGLLLLLLLFVTLATLLRSNMGYAVFGGLLALAAAALGNSLRIVALAVGLVYQPALGGLDVFAEPWHSTLGLATLAISALPLLLWAHYGRGSITPPPTSLAASPPPLFPTVKPLVGFAFLVVCIGIITLPPQPLDVARPQVAPQLPDRIARFAAQHGVLTEKEQAYFIRYGGGAARAAYGPYGLLVVSTSAPLRHLHSPEECLAGNGHTVRYLGQTGGLIPSAVYRSTDPQGRDWRITVSFVSEHGEWTPHVAEAIWRWLQAPGTTWRMIQRIAPWELPETTTTQFDLAVWRALDLSPPASLAKPQPMTIKL